MSDYVIGVNCNFVSPRDADDDDFGRFLNLTAAEYEKIGDGDLQIAASLTGRSAEFTVIIPGSSQDAALAKFLVELRIALHAADCATPDWPTFAVRDQEVRELQPA